MSFPSFFRVGLYCRPTAQLTSVAGKAKWLFGCPCLCRKEIRERKKRKFFFVLFSLNRTFAFKKEGEGTCARQKKESFSLFCSR